MRKITMIVLHCDGLRPDQHNTVKKIDDYHRSKGWKGIGYHFWVNRQGEVFTGRRLEVVGAHVVGHNSHSIGICYEGGLNAAGVDTDTRTPEQVRALRQLVERMHRMFPKAIILGHRDLNPGKPCPCFDAVREYIDLQPRV
jgi:N-acetyl-anhydromuramyl-L-alanine amidase AmpD